MRRVGIDGPATVQELCEVGTGRVLRNATPDEVRRADIAASKCAGGEGVIVVDGVRCYVSLKGRLP